MMPSFSGRVTAGSGVLRQKVVHARTIYDAVALIHMDHMHPDIFSGPVSHLLDWSIDKPLCRHCLQEIAETNGLCFICKDTLALIDAVDIRADAGILVSSIHPASILNAPWDIPDVSVMMISETEVLVVLPHDSVGDGLMLLMETLSDQSHCVGIVFPGKGVMTFADALAMARYYAGNVNADDRGFHIKFFFNHAHMRAFDFDDYLPISLVQRLLETAAEIKAVFHGKDRALMCELLKKDQVNRVYELTRFYSMCDQAQKALMSRIQMETIDPQKALLLFQLVRYVRSIH